MNGISRESFERMEVGSKLDVLYDCIGQLHKSIVVKNTEFDGRLKKLEARKNLDTLVGSGTGGLAGALVIWVKGLWGGP